MTLAYVHASSLPSHRPRRRRSATPPVRVARVLPRRSGIVFAANGPDHDVRLRFFSSERHCSSGATVAAHAVPLTLGRRGAALPSTLRYRHHRGQRSSIKPRQAKPDKFPAARTRPPLPFKTTASPKPCDFPPLTARDHAGTLAVHSPMPGSWTPAPNVDTLLSLGTELGTEGFFVFALDRNRTLVDRTRMFAPRSASRRTGHGTRMPCWRLPVGSRPFERTPPPSSPPRSQMKRPENEAEIDQRPWWPPYRRRGGYRARHPGIKPPVDQA